MGGLFGIVSQADCVADLYYGTDYHSHLGTKRGGMAVRNVACLPALTGAWRHAGCGALLSTSGNFPVDGRALARPDLYPDAGRFPPRTLNMAFIGEVLLETRDPPVRAIHVYNSNPVAVAPDGNRVRAGFAREDDAAVIKIFPGITLPEKKT